MGETSPISRRDLQAAANPLLVVGSFAIAISSPGE
jgi:hypothetical protein